MKLRDRTDLSFLEATSVIIGHGIGAGILAVPALAAHNNILHVVLIIVFCTLFNILLHLLISELSLNNGGAQFVKCFNAELFSGNFKKIFTLVAFILMGFSVMVNVGAYLTGAAEVFEEWFGLDEIWGMLLFYVVCTAIVFFGIKLVGICEKYAVAAIVAVVFVLLAAVLSRETCAFSTKWYGINNVLALYGEVSFALSSVMSTPQVVKGLGGNAKKVRAAVICGVIINATIVMLITITTLLATGEDVTEDGALVDLARHMGGWVSVVGYVFTLLALCTSFWTNMLNLRDIIIEQFHWGKTVSWAIASVPPILLAVIASSSFVFLSRIAGIITVVTSLGIILAYNKSRKRVGKSELLGSWGTLPFQLLILLCSLGATIGSVLTVS